MEEWRPRGASSQSEAMFKVAYFSFLAALAAIPVHLVTGNSASRAVVLGLLLVSAVFTAIGFQRRP